MTISQPLAKKADGFFMCKGASCIIYARAFDWRNYEYTKKPLEFSNSEAGFLTFKAWIEALAQKHGKTSVIPGMEPTAITGSH